MGVKRKKLGGHNLTEREIILVQIIGHNAPIIIREIAKLYYNFRKNTDVGRSLPGRACVGRPKAAVIHPALGRLVAQNLAQRTGGGKHGGRGSHEEYRLTGEGKKLFKALVPDPKKSAAPVLDIPEAPADDPKPKPAGPLQEFPSIESVKPSLPPVPMNVKQVAMAIAHFLVSGEEAEMKVTIGGKQRLILVMDGGGE